MCNNPVGLLPMELIRVADDAVIGSDLEQRNSYGYYINIILYILKLKLLN